jgi:hypothetical protein
MAEAAYFNAKFPPNLGVLAVRRANDDLVGRFAAHPGFEVHKVTEPATATFPGFL